MKKLLILIATALPVAALAQNTGIGTTSPTDQLHTTGTVRFEGYRGPGTRVVQVDSSGRMIVTGAGAISTAYPGAAIPDNGCATGSGVTSTINITGQAAAVASSKIALRVNITHPSDNDLRILLVAPNGAVLLLTGGVGNNGANLTNTVFTDAGLANLSGTGPQPPFTGKYKPVGAVATICLLASTVSTFGAIGGGNIVPNGNWTLKVYDGVSGNTGTLNKWEISFSGPESFTTADQNNYIPRFNSGNFDASNIYQDPSTGNIGINGSNATYPLTVNAANNGIVQSDAADGVQVGTYANGSGGWLQTYTNHPLYFTTNNGGAQMTLTTPGAVGLGTSSPAARLHIYSAGTLPGLLIENSTALAIGVNNDLLFKTGTNYTGLIRTRGTGTANAAMGFYTNATASSAGLIERLTIADGGNVGIGNINPSYTLDVTGTLHSTGQALIGGSLSINGQTNVNGALKYTGSTPGVNKVLTSDATGNASWTGPIAFRAYLTNNVSSGSSTTISPLTGYTVEYDMGGNFNGTTGKFTAPAAGIYHFDATVIVNSNYNSTNPISMYVALSRSTTNGENMTQFYQIPYTDSHTFNFGETLSLGANETVELDAYYIFVGGAFTVISFPGGFGPPQRTSFSGFLVK